MRLVPGVVLTLLRQLKDSPIPEYSYLVASCSHPPQSSVDLLFLEHLLGRHQSACIANDGIGPRQIALVQFLLLELFEEAVKLAREKTLFDKRLTRFLSWDMYDIAVQGIVFFVFSLAIDLVLVLVVTFLLSIGI